VNTVAVSYRHYTLHTCFPVTVTLFWANTEHAGRQKFTSDAEMQSAIHQWLGQQPASFFDIRHSETC